MLRMKKIGILMGGLSAEREISLQSGEYVYETLVKRGYDATRIFVDRDIDMDHDVHGLAGCGLAEDDLAWGEEQLVADAADP